MSLRFGFLFFCVWLAAVSAEPEPFLSCYPKGKEMGSLTVLKEGGGKLRVSLREGATARNVTGKAKEYGDGRLQFDGSGVSLSVGNQVVLDSTTGNYSYLVGVLVDKGETRLLRCYLDEVHRWPDRALYREMEEGDREGLVQKAQGRLVSQGYRKLLGVKKSEAGSRTTLTMSYENPASHAKRTLLVVLVRRGAPGLGVESATVQDSAAKGR